MIAAEDAARYRDAFGCNAAARPAAGVHRAGCPPARVAGRPLRRARTARSRAADVARRFASPVERIVGALAALEADDRVVHGEFRPERRRAASAATPTCSASCAGVRWRCCAARSSRSSPRPTPGSSRRGTASPASAAASMRWSRRSASCRVRRWWRRRWRPSCCRRGCARYRAADLDELCTTGDVVWVGARRDRAQRRPDPAVLRRPVRAARRLARGRRAADGPAARRASAPTWRRTGPASGTSCASASADATDGELLAALWDLVWAGEVTNDSLAPLRAMLSGGKASRSSAAPRGRPRPGRLTRIGPPAGRRPLVAGRAAATPGAVAHPGGARRGAAAARALRRGHPRGGAGRGREGWVRRDIRRAEGARRAWPGPPRLLRRRPRRRPVRPARCGRPAAVGPRGGRPHAASRAGSGPGRPRRPPTRPSRTARRSTGPSRRAAPAAPRAQSSCCAAACRWRGSTAARRTWSRSPTSADGSWAEALATLVKDGRQRSIEVRKVNGAPIERKGSEAAALLAAGFAEGYRGFTLRGT